MWDDKKIPFDGYDWPPEAFLQSLKNRELGREEFWRRFSYAFYAMRDVEPFIAALNDVKREVTGTGFPQSVTTVQNEPATASVRLSSGTATALAMPLPQCTIDKQNRKPGARETNFEDFVINKAETADVIDRIKNNINRDQAKQSAIVICAAIEAGKVSKTVTAASIHRKFGVNEASIKPHLRKYRQGGWDINEDIKPYKELFSSKDSDK